MLSVPLFLSVPQCSAGTPKKKALVVFLFLSVRIGTEEHPRIAWGTVKNDQS